jgi:hypothetical protein
MTDYAINSQRRPVPGGMAAEVDSRAGKNYCLQNRPGC